MRSVLKRCADCSYWRESPDEQDLSGLCYKALDWSTKWPPLISAAGGEPLDAFGATDAEGYSATVRTGPEFYCKHFQMADSERR